MLKTITTEALAVEPAGTYELTNDAGRIVLHVDRAAQNVWLEAQDGYNSTEMADMLAQASRLGIVPMWDDAAEELTETGVRRYCRTA